MDKLSMCRVCLVKDVPLRLIENKSLQQVYEDFVHIRFVSKSRRPALLCAMCCARLQSCHRFKTSCLQGEALFKQILKKNAGITIKEKQRSNLKKLSTTGIKHVTCSGAVGIADNAWEDSEQEQSTLMHSIVTEVDSEHFQDTSRTDSLFNDEDEDELERMSKMMIKDPERIITTTVKIEREGDDFEFDEIIKWPVAEAVVPAAVVPKAVVTAVVAEVVPQRTASIKTQQEKPEQTASSDLTPASALTPTCDPIAIIDLTSNSNRSSQKKPSQGVLLKDIKIVLKRCDERKSNKPKRFGLRSIIPEEPSSTKTYECDLCDKRYHNEKVLSTHRRMHFQDKKHFQCDVCNKRYKYKGTVIRHLRLHTAEKPYECKVCHKRFNEITNLKSHMRTHPGGQPFK